MKKAASHDEKHLGGAQSWTRWYLLVIGWLAVLIILFYLFTKYFS